MPAYLKSLKVSDCATKMRIITRADFDGLICSVLITEAEDVDEILLVHPKKMQDGNVAVTDKDIIVNLPYHPDCGKWFDHHISEANIGDHPENFEGKYGLAPSCARLIYEYYNLPEWKRYFKLLAETDKIDSAQLELTDILRPSGWMRLANTIDPRTGFEKSEAKEFFFLLMDLIKNNSIEEILTIDEVRERVREFFEHRTTYEEALQRYSRIDGDVVITDFRSLDTPPLGSRFLVYAMFPSANVALRVFYETEEHDFVRITVGRSILNRTCTADIGTLLHEYGGGGHVGAGSCRAPQNDADDLIARIVRQLNEG